ncbi:MAG: ComF family protein [Gallionella sp.]|nr:ComF family protein [Gallionella sp.]
MSILSHRLLNIGLKFGHLLPAQPCVLCGAFSRDGVCCAACDTELPRLPATHCPACALPTLAGELCGKCLQQPPAFDHTVAAFSYSFPINQLIKALKFHERLLLANLLADELASRIPERPDLIVALPLHPLRLRERGFNQSQLLAARLSKQLNIPLLTDACRRVRDTPPQSKLPWKERDKNMRHAFAISPDVDIQSKHVAIVDDVMTTGASIGEMAHMLKQAGARKVSAWVVARTLPHHERGA